MLQGVVCGASDCVSGPPHSPPDCIGRSFASVSQFPQRSPVPCWVTGLDVSYTTEVTRRKRPASASRPVSKDLVLWTLRGPEQGGVRAEGWRESGGHSAGHGGDHGGRWPSRAAASPGRLSSEWPEAGREEGPPCRHATAATVLSREWPWGSRVVLGTHTRFPLGCESPKSRGSAWHTCSCLFLGGWGM